MTKLPRSWLRSLPLLLVGAVCWLVQSEASAATPAPQPETIYCVSHIKPGSEAAYAALQKKVWATYRRLDVVLPKPHLVVRGVDEAGKTYYVEIFTWKDAEIPDHAPKEIRNLWQEWQSCCEPRAGRPGIDFSDGGVTIVESE